MLRSDGLATIVTLAVFVALLVLFRDFWNTAIAHGWFNTALIALAKEYRDADDWEPDDPWSYYSVAALGVSSAVAFRSYRWIRAGKVSGDLTSQEFALSTETIIGSLLIAAIGIAVGTTGMRVPRSGLARILGFGAVAYGLWKLYPWLEARALTPNSRQRE